MAISNWPNLLNQFQQMQQELGRTWERGSHAHSENDASNIATAGWAPAVDIKEKPDHFQIIADIPGVDPKNIKVTMENNMLTIQGERKEEKEEKGENYYRAERSVGNFYRRFSLPDTADSQNISAKGKHGVLEITIPKTKKSQAQKIDIKVE
jgi:HSP20 family protein